MSFLSYAWNWLLRPAPVARPGQHPAAAPRRTSVTAARSLLVAALIAVPAGVAIGHTGRGAVAVVNLAIAWRAIPTLGLLILFVGISARLLRFTWLVPLAVLAVPPILVNTYEGVAAVDPVCGTRRAGSGMTAWQQVRASRCRWRCR